MIGDDVLYKSNVKVKAWAERVQANLKDLFQECDREGLAGMRNVYNQMAQSKL